MRTSCLRCLKSSRTCYCARLRPFSSQVRIVLLQHPSERRKAIGTARMAHLSIEGSRLIVGESFDADPEVNALIDDPGNHCMVLYPGKGARDIAADPSMPAEKAPVVFVIDGTWGCARGMLNRSRRLAALPRISFPPGAGSEYLIRKQPHPHCLSTIEAVHRVLEILDPEAGSGVLLDVFRGMVNDQARWTSF